MKKWSIIIVLLCISILCIVYNDSIISYLVKSFGNIEKKSTVLINNNYAGNYDYEFVQLVDYFVPTSKQDIINIYYTILNSGMNEFTFYCPKEYQNCIKDIDYLSDDQVLISNINNFLPVYNNFQNIDTEFDSLGKVTVSIQYRYHKEEIEQIENKLTNIIQENIKENMSLEEKIKVIHDYIINTTKYDVNRSDKKVTTYHSDTAYGALIEHYAICSGYADSMKLFLDYLKIPNYKVSSENHIWNLVCLNNKWYHLDLTWDDPVTSSGADVLEYDYFLISTEELQKLESDQHIFDSSVYKEANNN